MLGFWGNDPILLLLCCTTYKKTCVFCFVVVDLLKHLKLKVMENKFNDGDRVRYVREAPEDCGMTIELDKFIGTYQHGIIYHENGDFPLDGICDISECFDKIDSSTCLKCNATNSVKWDKHTIAIADKLGSYRDLSFNYCEECGNVTNIEVS